jgi:uncharacterized FlgJ-related protein
MKKFLILFIFLSISSSFLCYTDIESLKNKQCTKENVYFEIKKSGILHPDVVFAQVLLESSNLKSKLTKTNNNFLGMKFPKKRATTAIANVKGYAKYFQWKDCINDYLLYQNYILRNKNMSRQQYLSFLGKQYSECNSYKKRLLGIIKSNKDFIRVQDSLYYCSTL